MASIQDACRMYLVSLENQTGAIKVAVKDTGKIDSELIAHLAVAEDALMEARKHLGISEDDEVDEGAA